MHPDGRYVVTWQSYGQTGQSGSIFAQRFDAQGLAVGNEFRVNTNSTGNKTRPSVAIDLEGDFIIAWQSDASYGGTKGIFAQRYSWELAPIESEFKVNTTSTGDQKQPEVAVDDDGDFVVTWQNYDTEAEQYGVFAQCFSSSGESVQDEIFIDQAYFGPVGINRILASVGMAPDGDFAVTWMSYVPGESVYGTYFKRFNVAGVAQGASVRVESNVSEVLYTPRIAMGRDSSFMIVWEGFNRYLSLAYGVLGQRFSETGDKLGPEIHVQTIIGTGGNVPAIAFDSDGDFQVAWEEPDSQDLGIAMRRFRTAHPDQLAVKRSTSFYLDSNHSKTWNGGATDTLNSFGASTDKPLAGDWNGDGYTDIAVWRNGTFYLDANGNGLWDGPSIDKTFKFGLNTDTPLVGDWNGDGKDDIGAWRAGKFYLDLDGNRIWNSAIDKAFTFGASTDTPLIGDWNADGKDDLGIWRAGKFYLDLNANRAWNSGVDGIFTFGLNTDTPLIGDWNADGTDDIAVWRNGKFYQDSNGNRAWNSANDTVTTFGTTTDTPLIGYWRPKTIPGTPPNATPAPSPTPAAPLSIQVTPTAVTPFDFSGRWNYTGDIVNGFIRVNQTGKKASTLLRIGDLEFDMQAKIKGDRLTGKFSKNLPDTKIRGKFEATRINSTTFSGLLTISTNNNPAELPILGTRV